MKIYEKMYSTVGIKLFFMKPNNMRKQSFLDQCYHGINEGKFLEKGLLDNARSNFIATENYLILLAIIMVALDLPVSS